MPLRDMSSAHLSEVAGQQTAGIDQGRLDILEALRFFAALAVVFVHLPSVGVGGFGVDVFFVISGLVMMLSTEKGAHQFFLKRLIRIVPLYWLMTLLIFGVAVFFPALLGNTTASIEHLLKSLFFIPFDKNGSGHRPVLFLGWTLNYEMFFYLLFFVALKIKFVWRGLLTSVMLLVFVGLGSVNDSFVAAVYGDTMVMEFVMGIALYEVLRMRRAGHLLLYVLVLLLPIVCQPKLFYERGYFIGLPCLLFVLSAAAAFRESRIPKWLVFLGGASYSLYLLHAYVIQFMDKKARLFGNNIIMDVVASCAAIVVSVGLSLLVYKYFERPLNERLRISLRRLNGV